MDMFKKILTTIMLIVMMSFAATAQSDGFFDDHHYSEYRDSDDPLPMTPDSHGLNDNVDAPVGNGLLILSLLGVGYAVKKIKDIR